MKTLSLALAFLAAPALAQTSALPVPASAPARFDWKLRLTKGQTWTQTIQSQTQSRFNIATSAGPMNFEMNMTQTITSNNEVLEATPTFYLIRMTYTRFDFKTAVKVNGKTQPTPATPEVESVFKGASFTLKQARDGRVLNVTGIEEFVARHKYLLGKVGKTSPEDASMSQFTPSVQSLRDTIAKTQSIALPKTPLVIGQSYSYALSFSAIPFPTGMQLNNRRTLHTLDAQLATFVEDSTYSISAGKPMIAGKTKTYTAMKGTQSGFSQVQISSGLPTGSQTTLQIAGRITTIDSTGNRTTVPLDMTTKSTMTVAF